MFKKEKIGKPWKARKPDVKVGKKNCKTEHPPQKIKQMYYILRTVPPFVTAHTFCASQDIRLS